MVRVPAGVTAAQRLRWLAELSEALDEAQTLLARLEPDMLLNADALDLSARIETVRAQVRLLRRGRRMDAAEEGPCWISPLPWAQALGRCGG